MKTKYISECPNCGIFTYCSDKDFKDHSDEFCECEDAIVYHVHIKDRYKIDASPKLVKFKLKKQKARKK